MIEITGNIWDQKCDWICITTNGEVKSNGRAVMGRGIAKQAVERFKNIDLELAKKIEKYGNTVQKLYPGYFTVVEPLNKELHLTHIRIVSFPTKHEWRDKADLELIKSSVEQLYFFWYENCQLSKKELKVCLPKPGCENGGLTWNEVKPVIEPILKSDNFVIVDLK